MVNLRHTPLLMILLEQKDKNNIFLVLVKLLT
jgi:hypothetical protein